MVCSRQLEDHISEVKQIARPCTIIIASKSSMHFVMISYSYGHLEKLTQSRYGDPVHTAVAPACVLYMNHMIQNKEVQAVLVI